MVGLLPVLAALGLVVAAVAGSGPGILGAERLVVGHPSPTVPVPAAGTLSATITWNGVPIGQASSTGSAFVLGAGQSATVLFNVTEPLGGPTVSNASLVLLYLGVSLSTVSIPTPVPEPVGGWSVSWSFGSLIYLTEGVYEVDAQLTDANGSVLLQQPFYVDARAPYLVGSAILSMVVILGLAELLWVRTVVRYRRSRRGRYRYR